MAAEGDKFSLVDLNYDGYGILADKYKEFAASRIQSFGGKESFLSKHVKGTIHMKHSSSVFDALLRNKKKSKVEETAVLQSVSQVEENKPTNLQSVSEDENQAYERFRNMMTEEQKEEIKRMKEGAKDVTFFARMPDSDQVFSANFKAGREEFKMIPLEEFEQLRARVTSQSFAA